MPQITMCAARDQDGGHNNMINNTNNIIRLYIFSPIIDLVLSCFITVAITRRRVVDWAAVVVQ